MSTNNKVKVTDDFSLRTKIEKAYKDMTPSNQAKWAISIAKRILHTVKIDYKEISEVVDGFNLSKKWQLKKASIEDVRQASFKIHTVARKYKKEVEMTALRVAGHAVATAYMSEHALVASDLAINVISMIADGSMDSISNERKWQLDEIKVYR